MRPSALPVFLALALLCTSAQAEQRYPVISTKSYPTAKGAATGGGAYAITRGIARRGLLGSFGTFRSRQITVTEGQGDRFSVQARRSNPDNGQPLASTTINVVRTRNGKFHFVDPGTVSLNLPILTTTTDRHAAARAAGAKAMLKNGEVKRWFASDGVEGADVVKKLSASVEKVSSSGKTARLRVYTRANGQDGYPMVETSVWVRQLKNGQWRGYDKSAAGLQINDLWE